MSPETKTSDNRLNQLLKKGLGTVSETTKVHITNELQICTSLPINQIIETNLIVFLEFNNLLEILLRIINVKLVKIQI